MSCRSHSELWRQDWSFTVKKNTGQFDSPAKDSDLDPENLVDSVKQRDDIVAVCFGKITGAAECRRV